MSPVVKAADGARKTRVLFAGDMEFAKAQFASIAPQLLLVPASAVLGAAGDSRPEPFDVALIDCAAPGVDARAIVDGLRARSLDAPIVLALDPGTGHDSPARVTAELRVDDYTVKLPGWLARLALRLEFAIAHHRRRRSIETLQASAERLRAVVESAPVCLARVTRDGTILAMNDAAMKMVSAETAEDVLGKSLLTFVEPGQAEAVTRFIDSVSTGQPGSLEFSTAGLSGVARTLDTRAVPLAADAEGRASALLVMRDATERKRLEESVVATAEIAGFEARAAEERDALRRQLDEVLEQCRRLDAERDGLRGELESARAEAAAAGPLQAAGAAAEARLRAVEAECERLTTERAELTREVTAARLRHDAASADLGDEREKQRTLVEAADRERARLAGRCEALEALVAQAEASCAAERQAHETTRARLEAELRRRDEAAPLDAEREALQASVAALRTQFDEVRAALDAAEARHATEMTGQRAAAAALDADLRAAAGQRAALTAERDELRAALELAQSRADQLQAAVEDVRARRDAHIVEAENIRRALEGRIDELEGRMLRRAADGDADRDELRAARDAAAARAEQLAAALLDLQAARDAQAADAEAVRRTLVERIEELHVRVQAAIAERDTVRDELRLAVDTADARNEQLQAALDGIRADHAARAAEADGVRQSLAQRVEELQRRLDAVIIDRESLERALDDARAELASRLREAAGERELLMRRLQTQDAEYAALSAHQADLQARLEAAEAAAAAQPAPAATPAAEPPAADLHDAQAAFHEAFQLLSGELQSVIETTRAQQAAILRGGTAPYDALEERLRAAESECRRLAAERDERDAAVRTLNAEIEQHLALRREQRKELVRVLQEAEENERRAAARVRECARLRQMLADAQAALQRLSQWAATQSTRLALPSGGRPAAARIETPARAGRDDGDAAPPLETSWS